MGMCGASGVVPFEPHGEKSVKEELDMLFRQVTEAWATYESTTRMAKRPCNRDLETRMRAVETRSRATHTEAHLLEVLCSGSTSKSIAERIQRRMASMTKHAVPNDMIMRQIWDRAMSAIDR